MNVSSLSPTVLVFNPYQMRGDSNAFRSRSLVNREGLLEKFYHGGLTSIVPGQNRGTWSNPAAKIEENVADLARYDDHVCNQLYAQSRPSVCPSISQYPRRLSTHDGFAVRPRARVCVYAGPCMRSMRKINSVHDLHIHPVSNTCPLTNYVSARALRCAARLKSKYNFSLFIKAHPFIRQFTGNTIDLLLRSRCFHATFSNYDNFDLSRGWVG